MCYDIYRQAIYIRRRNNMAISADMLRGHTETIILAQLIKNDSYGYEISKAIEDLSHGELILKDATLYTAFRRMEHDGFIESYWGESDAGARRRYYRITEKGRSFYDFNKTNWFDTIKIMKDLINGGTK